jgi:tetratricopeptide (TPR) repeat protein
MTVSRETHEARRLAEEGIALADGDLHVGVETQGVSAPLVLHGQLAGALMRLGRADEARAAREHGLRLSQQLQEPVGEGLLRFFSTPILLVSGDGAAMLADARRMVELAETTTNQPLQIAAWGALGRALHRNGDVDAAAAACERAMAGGLSPIGHHTLAEILAARGHVARALELLDEAMQLSAGLFLDIDARLARIRVLHSADALGEPDAAERELDELAELCRTRPALDLAPEVCLARADLAERRGDRQRLLAELREARRLFAGLGATLQVARIDRRLEGGDAAL